MPAGEATTTDSPVGTAGATVSALGLTVIAPGLDGDASAATGPERSAYSQVAPFVVE